jgi:predicted PurR-regulated permease PerM
MKKFLTLLTAAVFTMACWAQNSDYLLNKDFQSEKKKLSEGIDAAKKSGSDAKKTAVRQMTVVDSLSKVLVANQNELVKTNDSLQKTAAQFSELESRVVKSSMSAINSLIAAVVIIAVLFILVLALVFFLKSKTDKLILELAEANKNLEETLKKDIAGMKEEVKKSADSLALTLHELSAKMTARIVQGEERQKAFAAELEELVDKVMKEQEVQKSRVDEKVKELLSAVNADKTEHKSVHEKIESEFKGLRSLHTKDVEDIRAKLKP